MTEKRGVLRFRLADGRRCRADVPEQAQARASGALAQLGNLGTTTGPAIYAVVLTNTRLGGMTALTVLFSVGLFEHYFGMHTYGMSVEIVDNIFAGLEEDRLGIVWKYYGAVGSWYAGVTLLWLAAVLTLITGVDYYLKALPYLRETDAP